MPRRTSLITAAAIGGALLAGTGAIAANIGVLESANDDSIGNLSAGTAVAAPATTVEEQVIDIYIEDPPATASTIASDTASTTASTGASTADAELVARQYAVGDAGTVTVERTSTGLFVGDVRADEGWTWSTAQSGPDDLTVTFTSPGTTYEFHAAVDADGLIEARVDQPIVNVVRTPTTAPSASDDRYVGDDDDHDDDDHDEDEGDEHDEHDEDEEHEGGDDDD